MIRHDIKEMADVIEALEEEITALAILDPYDPQITLLRARMEGAIRDLYQCAPRGV